MRDGAEERAPEPPRIEHEGVYPAGQRKHHELVQWMVDRGDPFSLYLAETTPDLPRGEVDPAALGEATLARGRELAVDAFSALKEELLTASETLKTFLAGFEPVDVIACISLRQTFIAWGTYYEPTEEGSEVVVEIVVGLYATLGPDVHGTVRPTGHDLNEVEEQVQNIRNLVFLYNFAGQMAGEMSGIEGTSAAYWMNVRGTGHRAHAYQIAEHVYTATQRFFEPVFGFTITQYLHLVDAIETLVQDRVTAYAHRPDVGRSGGKVEEIRELLELSSEDLAEPSGLPREVVRAILERLSLSLPADVPARYSGPFDECLLARRPFVKSGDERYLLPIFGIAGRDFISVFDPELMREGREPYSLARAFASDDYAIELLARVLPGCETASHLFYDVTDGTAVERCEVDGVVEFENYLIIVEGKASSISVAAQRGDVRKAASQVAEVIGRAWKQADRLKRLVIENDATDLVNGDGDVVKTLGRFPPDRVLLINPTLYCLGLLSLVVPTLQQVYAFDAGPELWSICLSDLQVVVDILATLHFSSITSSGASASRSARRCSLSTSRTSSRATSTASSATNRTGRSTSTPRRRRSTTTSSGSTTTAPSHPDRSGRSVMPSKLAFANSGPIDRRAGFLSRSRCSTCRMTEHHCSRKCLSLPTGFTSKGATSGSAMPTGSAWS